MAFDPWEVKIPAAPSVEVEQRGHKFFEISHFHSSNDCGAGAIAALNTFLGQCFENGSPVFNVYHHIHPGW